MSIQRKSQSRSTGLLELNRRQRIDYGVGDLGLNFYWQGANFFLIYYFTEQVGLPASLAGTIFALGGLVDAITDPAMGFVADRTRSRYGSFRPYLLFAAIPLGLSFAALFIVPAELAGPAPMPGITIAALVLFRLCYTAVSIPYGALAGRLTLSPRSRVELAGARMFCGALGGSMMAVAAWSFRGHEDELNFAPLSLVAGLVGCILILWTFAHVRELPRTASLEQEGPPSGLQSAMKQIVANRPFLMLIGAIVALTIANTLLVTTVLYRFEGLLGRPDLGPVALMVLTLTPLIAIPLWTRVFIWLGSRRSSVAGAIVTILGITILALFGQEIPVVCLLAFGAVGIGFSAFAVGFWSMLPDTIDFGTWRFGYARDSSMVGLASAIQKLSIALAGFSVGLLLQLTGLLADTPSTIQQEAFHYWFSLLPLALMIVAAIFFAAYPLNRRRRSILSHALARRL